jgi:hypothetical protein
VTIRETFHYLPASAEHLGQIARNVVASLPVTSLGNADHRITFVEGEGAWDELALQAVTEGAKGIVLDRPAFLPSDRVEALAVVLRQRGVSLVVRSIWSSHAMMSGAQECFDTIAQPVLLDIVIGLDETTDNAKAAVAALSMIHTLVGPARRLVVDGDDSTGFSARGIVADAGIPLTIAAHRSCRDCRIDIRLLGVDGIASVSARYSATWEPLLVTSADAVGGREWPAHFESPDRSVYARLLQHIAAGGNWDDLAHLAAICPLIEADAIGLCRDGITSDHAKRH